MESQANQNSPTVIPGGIHKDERGAIIYNNDFDLSLAKRFYSIQPTAHRLRGWQGHKREQKWFTATRGSLLVLVVQPDDWENPTFGLKPLEYILNAERGDVLHVPGGYATAFKPITPDAMVSVFSDFTLEESLKDSFRFDERMWYYETFF